MQEMAFKKLVRFAYNGRIEYGDLLGSNSSGHTISRLVGDLEIGLRDSGNIVTASKVFPDNLVPRFLIDIPLTL
jgi:hypothetical protein